MEEREKTGSLMKPWLGRVQPAISVAKMAFLRKLNATL
jgi:hypothetical protein